MWVESGAGGRVGGNAGGECVGVVHLGRSAFHAISGRGGSQLAGRAHGSSPPSSLESGLKAELVCSRGRVGKMVGSSYFTEM